MYSISDKLMPKVLVATYAVLLTISCFQVNGLDKKEEFVFQPIVGNGKHLLEYEIQEIHENAKELFSKLIACTKNQTKCKEFDEITTQIESNFAQGNHLSQENEQYIKLQQRYAQFKLAQEGNLFLLREAIKLQQAYNQFKKFPQEKTEKEKNTPLKERLAKKYIGEIPDAVDDMLFYLQNYEEYSKTQIPAPNQILLHGSPGTGKTHLVKTIAEELELPIIEINANNFYYGKNSIVNVFENLEKRDQLTIVFIDDIDIIANNYSKERGILLTKLNNMKNDKKTFIFCATNNLESLDDNFKRKFLTAQIKDLSLEERAQLFKKEFADNGKIIGDEFAAMLAQATSAKSKEFSEYSTTRRIELGDNRVLNEHHLSAFGFSMPNDFHYKRIKYHPSEFIFDNRDIGKIVISTLIKHQECLKNLEKGQCFLSQSAEKAIRQMDKPANFSKWENKYYEE